MKAILFSITALIFTFSAYKVAYSDEVVSDILRSLENSHSKIEQNANRYSRSQLDSLRNLARQINNEADHVGNNNPSACYAKAYRTSGIDYDESKATELCSGGGSVETVDCFASAYRSSGISYDSRKAIRLCKNGGDMGAANCFNSAYRSSGINYDSEKALRLCEHRGSDATARCFDNAYRTHGISYDAEKAITLCSRGGTEQNVSCFETQYRQNGYNTNKAIDLCKN